MVDEGIAADEEAPTRALAQEMSACLQISHSLKLGHHKAYVYLLRVADRKELAEADGENPSKLRVGES